MTLAVLLASEHRRSLGDRIREHGEDRNALVQRLRYAMDNRPSGSESLPWIACIARGGL